MKSRIPVDWKTAGSDVQRAIAGPPEVGTQEIWTKTIKHDERDGRNYATRSIARICLTNARVLATNIGQAAIAVRRGPCPLGAICNFLKGSQKPVNRHANWVVLKHPVVLANSVIDCLKPDDAREPGWRAWADFNDCDQLSNGILPRWGSLFSRMFHNMRKVESILVEKPHLLVILMEMPLEFFSDSPARD